MTATSLMDATLATPQVLVSQQLAATETTQYTTAAAHWVKIAAATLVNTSGSPVTVSVSLCKSGQTVDGTQKVLSALALAAGDSLDILAGHSLGPGDFISAIASSSAVNFVMSGVVFS